MKGEMKKLRGDNTESTSNRNPPWWNRRTRLERSLIFITITSVLMISVMAVALAVFGYLHQKNMNNRLVPYFSSNSDRLVTTNTSRNLCLTPGCVKAAAQLLGNIDESMDPCVDFYQFACGKWLDRHIIPEDRSSVSVFSDAQDALNIKLRVLLEKPAKEPEPDFIGLIKTMYNSCMDEKKIEKLKEKPMLDALKAMGGWPVVEGSKWDESAFDWIDTLITFRQIGYSSDILLDMSVSTDYRNNSRHIIDLDQPGLGMPDRTYFLKGLNDSTTAAYYDLMVKAAVRLGADQEVAKDELKQALDFETKLANLSLPREERRNFSQLYNKMTIQELTDLQPEIDWMKYFSGLLMQKIYLNDSIIVAVPKFVKRLPEEIAAAGKRTVANYMIWRIVGMSMSSLNKEWRHLMQDYTKSLTGKSKEEPRWEFCLSSVKGTLGIALGSYYVRNYFKGDNKETAMEMIGYIQKEFLKILQNVDWMDEVTRSQAIDKANAITAYIGYPVELLNNTALSELYENVSLSRDDYFNNVMKIRRWITDYSVRQLRLPNIKGDWKKHARAAVVNAFYNSLENSIKFPAGILQNWFFNKDRPHYLNFGAIGYVMGHEITHGFDDRGRQFDKDGNNRNWWDEKTDSLYKKKARCIIEQYGNYSVTEVGLNVNGMNTVGENIADNGGLKEAYRAYHSWAAINGEEPELPGLKYNVKQLLWISSANVWCTKKKPELLKLRVIAGSHSPSRFRVVGPLSNIAEFAKDFQCPIGSPMNPKEKCQVW